MILYNISWKRNFFIIHNKSYALKLVQEKIKGLNNYSYSYSYSQISSLTDF